jgi:16S rRNA (guanine966-N2)-methyltransferase
MRIVAGAFRGRKLVSPAGRSTRPTADRARQALFDVLEHAPWSNGLEGARVIDLFAGSGALGIEALSRGASFCLFVDSGADASAAIAANVDRLGLGRRARLARRDATRLGSRPDSEAPFDLAFLDPPYFQSLVGPALEGLLDGRWLACAAVAVVERGAAEAPIAVTGFEPLDQRSWGAAQVGYLRPNSRSMSASFNTT